MKWRLMDTGPCDAFHNMALDEALAASARQGGGPVLRLYSWRSPSVSLGRFQDAGDMDADFLSGDNIDFVRRPTGGRGIFHAEELTYSLSAPLEGDFSGGLLEAYRRIALAFALAFGSVGLKVETDFSRRRPDRRSPLCFASTSYGEMTASGKKIIGSAQRRWADGFLQQGSIPLGPEDPRTRRAFPASASAGQYGAMPGLSSLLPGLGLGALKEAVRSSFEEAFGVELKESRPADREEALASRLVRKYRSPEWNLQRRQRRRRSSLQRPRPG